MKVYVNINLRQIYLPFTINSLGDAHDFCKERSALCAAKNGAGNIIVKIIVTFLIAKNPAASQ